jgi:hypothetical protein
MIDFTAVSREIRSLVSRRRELLTFLGSVFAALGLVLQNVLHGDLPASLKALEGHVFAFYALMLMAPSLILALRLAKLNAGLTLNGLLYMRLMQEQDFTRKGPKPEQAMRPNVFGVSFQMFLLANLIAGFSATLLALALGLDLLYAVLAGGLAFFLWLLLYFRYHRRAAAFAVAKAASEKCTPFDREQWEAHQSGSLEDANHDMITILALVGLMVFSAFEGLSGLGKATAGSDLPSQHVQDHGPTAYAVLMVVTCVMGLVAYLRLRIAVGHRSLEIDPTDRPFRPLRLTDSLLGYLLLVFLFVLSLHMLLFPRLEQHWLFGVDAAAFIGALLVEQLTLIVAGRRMHAVVTK